MTMLTTVDAPVKIKTRADLIKELARDLKSGEIDNQELGQIYRLIYGGKCQPQKDGKTFKVQGLPIFVEKPEQVEASAE